MMPEDIFLILTVLEGASFPHKKNHQLIVLAKLDGQLIATDPIPSTLEPAFNTELAWLTDKKTLQRQRLQKVPVKVECYLVSEAGGKELIGYLILSLRTVQEIGNVAAKWHRLLGAKPGINRKRPELYLYLKVELSKDPSQQHCITSAVASNYLKDVHSHQIQEATGLSREADIDVSVLQPVLKGGYYQIGPEDSCTDNFTLSVIIVYAQNLSFLLPSTVQLPTDGDGFYFYYSFFGCDITTAVFSDLILSDFLAEQSTARIRTSLSILEKFLNSLQCPVLYLCHGNVSLGYSEIVLSKLTEGGIQELYMQPIAAEQVCELKSMLNDKVPEGDTGEMPFVGISLKLSHVQMEQTATTNKQDSIMIIESFSEEKASEAVENTHKKHNAEHSAYSVRNGATLSVADTGQQNCPSTPPTSRLPTNRVVDSPPEKLAKEMNTGQIEGSDSRVKHENVGKILFEEGRDNVPVMNFLPHHFRIIMDLRSIVLHDLDEEIKCILNYSYSYFGEDTSISTAPAFHVENNKQLVIPHGLCEFNFATTFSVLENTLHQHPLVVDVLNAKSDKNVLVGKAYLNISQVLLSDKYIDNATNVPVQTCLMKSDIIDMKGKGRIGTLISVISLGDHGVVQIPVESASTARNVPSQAVDSDILDSSVDCLYKAAQELEEWKEQRKCIFESGLREKEMAHLATLTEEWKRRETEREVAYQHKLKECKEFQQKLEETINAVEEREKQLAAGELELAKLREIIMMEKDHSVKEAQEETRRIKEICEHKVNLESKKTTALEEEVKRLERKVLEREQELVQCRQEKCELPLVRLQQEMNVVVLEKAELENKLEAVTKSKAYYKLEWVKAVRAVHRIKCQQQEHARAVLLKQEQEIEQMRLESQAKEERQLLEGDRMVLREIKDEIQKLQEHSKEGQSDKGNEPPVEKRTEDNSAVRDGSDGRIRQRNTTHGLSQMSSGVSGVRATSSRSVIEEEIGRLVEERDTLLRTGVYASEDIVIAELDKKIREILSEHKS